MTIEYQARVEDIFGNHVKTFRNFIEPSDGGGAGLDYVLNVGKPAALLLTLPITEDPNLIPIDARVIPQRAVHGRAYATDNDSCYLVRKKVLTADWYRFTAYHANELLDRRSIAYMTGSSFALKTGLAGDVIKEFARENIGNSINGLQRDTAQAETDLVGQGLLAIENDLGDGATITKASDRGSLLRNMQGVADSSITNGTYMSFGMIYNNDKTWNLVTKAMQWGSDRRSGVPGAVVLSPQRGNLGSWRLTLDYSNEVTVAIAGGRGQNDEKIIAVAVDTARVGISPFGVRERFYDAPGADTQAAVQAVADEYLRQGEPKITFEADLIEGPKATRGVDYDLGDMITTRVVVKGRPFEFDCRLDTIYVSVRHGEQRSRVQLVNPL